MKGGLVLAIAAFQRLARAKTNLPLPITFLFNPDEEVGSVASRPYIEAEAVRNRYVLVTEPKRNGGKIVTRAQGNRALPHPRARAARTFGRQSREGPQRHPRHGRHHPADRGLHRLCARHHHQRRAGQRRNRRQRDPGVLHHRGRRARLRHGCGGRDGAEVCGPQVERSGCRGQRDGRPQPSAVRAQRRRRRTVRQGGCNRQPVGASSWNPMACPAAAPTAI